MRLIFVLALILGANSVKCYVAPATTPTTTPHTTPTTNICDLIQCTIASCNENEEFALDDGHCCGYCVPKSSKKYFIDVGVIYASEIHIEIKFISITSRFHYYITNYLYLGKKIKNNY